MNPLDLAAFAAVIGVICGALVALRLATMQELPLAREDWGQGKHKGALPEARHELGARRHCRALAHAARVRYLLAARGGVS